MNPPDIVEFVTDPQLLNLTLSEAQATLLRAIYGLPMTPSQLDLFRACTGRQHAPAGGFGEAPVIAGARAGKDCRISAPIMCYEALFGGHEAHLAKGERALAVKAVPRTLVDNAVCTPEELHRTVTAIDSEDGKADGRSPV